MILWILYVILNMKIKLNFQNEFDLACSQGDKLKH